MKLRKLIKLGVILALLISVSFWLVLRWARGSVASEGYDTEEAARNYFVRSGEIRFRLQEGATIQSLSSDGKKGKVESPTEAFSKLGYGVFSSTLEYRNPDGKIITLKFNTSKFNNWNRVLYLENKDGSFSRYDNGVLQEETLRQSNL